jgi:MFS transporter, DHA3 family, macrolide efflux protein
MGILRPLRGRSMALLWGGLSLSAVGDQLYTVALTWIAVGVLGSNAGYLGALQAFIALLAVLFIGIWADRWHQLRAMIAADLASAAVLVGVVVIALASGGPGITGLVCAIVVLAIGQAAFRPALQSVLPMVVEDTSLLPAANGLLDATARIARLLGPGLVAVLVGVVPVVHFLTLDAATFVASATALALIRRRRPAEPVMSRSVARAPVWSSIIRGYRATARHPLLNYYLSVSGLLNGAWYAVFYLCLPLLITRTGLGSSGGPVGLGAYGLILSAYGCGNLAATVFLGGRRLPARPQFQMLCGNIQWGCGVLLLAAANLLPVEWRLAGFAAAAAFTAIGGPMQDIPTAVLRQTRLSPHDRPATMRAYMMLVSLGVLVAMLLTPMAITRFGLAPVMVGCGALYLVVAAVGLARFARWHDADANQVTEPEPAMS